MDDPEKVAELITSKTKMIWLETPTNPLLNVIDIQALCELAQSHNILTIVDNTFATPYLQQPLNMGADIVLHSVTKYLNGHSDVVMGALVLRDATLHERLRFLQNACGAVPGPMDSFLTLRGIKTLHLRMRQHCANGAEIAQFLQDHPESWVGVLAGIYPSSQS